MGCPLRRPLAEEVFPAATSGQICRRDHAALDDSLKIRKE